MILIDTGRRLLYQRVIEGDAEENEEKWQVQPKGEGGVYQ